MGNIWEEETTSCERCDGGRLAARVRACERAGMRVCAATLHVSLLSRGFGDHEIGSDIAAGNNTHLPTCHLPFRCLFACPEMSLLRIGPVARLARGTGGTGLRTRTAAQLHSAQVGETGEEKKPGAVLRRKWAERAEWKWQKGGKNGVEMRKRRRNRKMWN